MEYNATVKNEGDFYVLMLRIKKKVHGDVYNMMPLE